MNESEASQLLTHVSHKIFIAILDHFLCIYIFMSLFLAISVNKMKRVGNFFLLFLHKKQNCGENSTVYTRCYLRNAYLCLSFTLHMWHRANGSSTATVLEGTDALISSCSVGEEGQEFGYLFYYIYLAIMNVLDVFFWDRSLQFL